ncbi:MAG: hypothetical protein QOH66_2422, partial [Actinomycetota bacterium]|nr:hypothetical protein [Actinomycetota bacterium]
AALVLASCGHAGSAADSRPIEDQLGFDQAGIQARQAKAETLIRDCMKAQGFDYVPLNPAEQQATLTGVHGMSEADFNKQFGFGITTLYDKQTGAAVGPNEKIRSELDAAGRAAYDKALRGEHTDADFQTAVDNGDYSRLGGCTKTAAEQVFGGLENLATLNTKLEELAEKILADKRMVAAVADWSKCMADAGYADLHYQDEVDAVLKQRLAKIVGPTDARRADYDHAALAALQRDEVTVVNADIHCEEKHVVPVDDKVRPDYEKAFKDANADLLAKVPSP